MTNENDESTSIRAEVKSALVESRPYLLSHHEPDDYHRCHVLTVRGQPVRVCARCSGVYPGIAVGLWLFATDALSELHLVLVALLPLPALLDWGLTHFLSPDGSNVIRTATGSLLGVGYGLGLGHLLVEGNPSVLVIGLVYGLLAAGVLGLSHSRSSVDR